MPVILKRKNWKLINKELDQFSLLFHSNPIEIFYVIKTRDRICSLGCKIKSFAFSKVTGMKNSFVRFFSPKIRYMESIRFLFTEGTIKYYKIERGEISIGFIKNKVLL